jgi:hypothetical protein
MTVDIEALRLRAEQVRARIPLSDVIGADVSLVQKGREHVGLCPFHHDARVGSFSVNDGKQLYKCFSCGAAGDHLEYLKQRKGLSFIGALKLLEADAGIDFRNARSDHRWELQREKRRLAALRDSEKRSAKAFGLWHHSALLKDTPAEAYLRGRGIDFAALGRFPGAIRYRHDCWNAELDRKIPAMVTAMTALDGRHVATHRTYLEYGPRGWTKARVEKAKMVLGDFAGAHMALWKGDSGRVPLRDVAEGTAVAIAEGIEDALTVAMADPAMRVIAAASLDNIGGVGLPDAVSDVVIIGQHDKPGSAADHALERQIGRLQDRGLSVLCSWPQPGFKDFNDQLRGVRMEAA